MPSIQNTFSLTANSSIFMRVKRLLSHFEKIKKMKSGFIKSIIRLPVMVRTRLK
jgi:hypothetical protein